MREGPVEVCLGGKGKAVGRKCVEEVGLRRWNDGTMELQLRFAYDYPRATPAYSIVLP